MGKYKRYKTASKNFSRETRENDFLTLHTVLAPRSSFGRTFQILHLPGGKRHAFDRYGCGSNVFILGFRPSGQRISLGRSISRNASKDPEDRPDFKNGGGIVINGNMAGKNGIAVSGAEARRIAGIPRISR